MADYRKLEVWQAAKKLAVRVYGLTASMPGSERFNLVSQAQRAAVSIVANIAEGAGRGTDLEFARFIRIAQGSLAELGAVLELAIELNLLAHEPTLWDEIRDLEVRLTNLCKRLERDGGKVREALASYANVLEPS